MEKTHVSSKSTSLFVYDSSPSMGKVLPISLQHIMAMFVGTVTVPIIIGASAGATDEEKRLL